MGCLRLTYRTDFFSVWRRDAYEKSDHRNFLPLGEKKDGSKKRDNYYPFGLKFNSYSRENSVPNTIKLFQGQEHIDDLGLNWDSFKWRNHQPDIGRFFNIDPLADKYVYNSPYAFSENKVVAHIELEGLESVEVNATTKSVEVKADGFFGDFSFPTAVKLDGGKLGLGGDTPKSDSPNKSIERNADTFHSITKSITDQVQKNTPEKSTPENKSNSNGKAPTLTLTKAPVNVASGVAKAIKVIKAEEKQQKTEGAAKQVQQAVQEVKKIENAPK